TPPHIEGQPVCYIPTHSLRNRHLGTTMRVMGPDLAILSAERYDDGRRAQRAASNGPAMKKAISSVGGKTIPKKRARKQPSVDHDEPDEEKKRARGRPRLDTTDQTPQEAGSPLPQLELKCACTNSPPAPPHSDPVGSESLSRSEGERHHQLGEKVESLKATNHQMTQAYQDVLEYASSSGLLDAKSALGRKLLRLEVMAKKSKSDDVYDDYDGSSAEGGTDDTHLPGEPRRQSVPSVSSSENVDSNGGSIKQTFARPDSTQQLWAGVMVTHEPVDEAEAAPRGQQLYPSLYDGPSSHPQDPLVVVQPIVRTLAYQEQSFARRLHRTALQRAARLITMKDPPSETILRVFGFARLFETLEQIRERTLGLLTRSERESLFNHGYPFQQLGGIGTHFPANEANEHVSSTMRGLPSRPKDDHPFTMGPMDPRMGKIRETLFWDPDEVQIYLMHNGVEIPPAVDHHTVELEDGAFGPPPSHVQNEDDRPQFAARNASSSTAPGAGTGTDSISGLDPTPVATVVASVRLTSPVSRPDAISATPNTAGASLWAHEHSAVGHFPPTGSAASTMSVFPTHPFPGPNVLGFPVEMAGSNYSIGESTWMSSCIVSISCIDCLLAPLLTDLDDVTELIIKMTCLGRSPGIRPKDVDLAFWASVTDSSSV
ncbi:hypothetical protein PG994_005309, partial [Apiospora phragmitis]